MDFSVNEKRRYNPKPRPKHKFDKQLINVNTTTNANTAAPIILFTATYPCVVMGMVISGCATTNAAGVNSLEWFVVLVEQGTTVSAPAFSGSAYAPEQQVMAFGAGLSQSGSMTQFHVKTKTGRKMRAGDTLNWVCSSLVAGVVEYCFIVQFFLKI